MNPRILGALALVTVGAAAWAQERPADAAAEPAAIVAGQRIERSAVDELIKAQLVEVRAREYQLRSKALDQLVADALIAREAAARGTTVEALEKTEVAARVTVSDAEVRALYEANKGRLGAVSEAEGLGKIRDLVEEQRRSERRQAFAEGLRSKYPVKVLLEPFRVPVEVADAPVRGNPKAPVTVVEFSDFQCPFCERARPTVARVREVYGDKVRWVFRHFPLGFHEQAEKAGEAAACAADQGKFWEMHDRLWATHSKLQVGDLKADAAALGLDTAAFDKCLDSGRHAELVQRDQEAGVAYGVSGTPAFFVNGRPLVGAQPFEEFQKVIDDELQREGIAAGKATASR
ncbi:MAG TPA: thioredoxin domain-containing protein [Vicinamibacteria bacterium]|nr:thioredoxin domain-containing protein [Vicinamibacteria bacterium]